MHKKHLFLILFILTLLFSGCQSQSAQLIREDSPYLMSESETYYAESAPSSPVNARAKSVTIDASITTADTERMVAREAELTIKTQIPSETIDSINQIANSSGGYTVYSNTSTNSASIMIRVPAGAFETTITAIEELTGNAENYVSNKRIRGVDITAEYTDTKSRLKSLETTHEKLNEILAKAETAEEALLVYQSIADVDQQIEVLKGQVKYLENRTALSSIEVEIRPIPQTTTISAPEWSLSETFKSAVSSFLELAKMILDVCIYVAVFFAPLVVLILIIVFIVKAVAKSKRRK